ncbi:MAG: ABC transporter substrate-binding protein [Acetobacter sp.]|nr:ABC transporter substrate-binding protein [Bacteroides sp.]MCM1341352.1 ABC transporter substrate-binding protein [Acetobacter sp.]MCM1433444.1 ABC transporter substrate-binding protein [Clostridiales bacterium]
MKKTMKKLIAVILAALIAIACFAGCSNSKETNENSTTPDTAKPAKFGIVVQSGANGAFVDMKDGIIDEMKAKGFENAEFVYKDANNDTAALTSIINAMDDGTYTAVFTIGTACTQTLVNLGSETPCFFCAVSAPVEAQVITDMAAPDKNATGTSNAIPVGDIIEMGYKITPDVTKWGFIYSTSQVNAVNTVEAAQKYLDDKGIKYESATVETSADVKSATETLISNGCDVIFVPNDAVVQDGVTTLAQICEEAKIPTYCSSATTVASGCLATLAIDDKGIGAKTADKCIEYMNGKAITEIPSEVVAVDYCTFNSNIAKSLGKETPSKDTIGYEIKVVE